MKSLLVVPPPVSILRRSLVMLAACLNASLLTAQPPAPIPRALQTAMGLLAKEPFRAHMAFLADDLLEGRGTGARGHELAARYIAAQFEALGLRPGGESGTFYQRVPLRESAVDPVHCAITVARGGAKQALKWGDDFLMFGNSLAPDVSVEGPVVFAGYGVKTPDGRYDDYAGVDVKGGMVAVLDGAPPTLPTELRAHMASMREKLRLARDRGAVGMVILRPPEADRILPWPRWIAGAAFPSMSWLGSDRQPGDSFPEIRITASLSLAASEQLFQGAPRSWANVLGDAKASKPQAFSLPVALSLREVSHLRDVSSPNVAAVLPGSDPKLKAEYVVYTAHSDHLGIGLPVNGDSIYNGAADDASGVSALLVMARALRSLPRPPARSILFLAVTGEEKGMLGSDYFAHFPTAPIRSIVADLNMDGASMFYTFKDIIPLGAADSSLGGVVEREAARLGLRVSPDPDPDQFAFVRSDQYSFVRQGVPALYAFEGYMTKEPKLDGKKISDEWTATRYHAPSDDMGQPMNLDASVQFMQLYFLMGYDIAQDPKRPAWKPGDFFGETFGRK